MLLVPFKEMENERHVFHYLLESSAEYIRDTYKDAKAVVYENSGGANVENLFTLALDTLRIRDFSQYIRIFKELYSDKGYAAYKVHFLKDLVDDDNTESTFIDVMAEMFLEGVHWMDNDIMFLSKQNKEYLLLSIMNLLCNEPSSIEAKMDLMSRFALKYLDTNLDSLIERNIIKDYDVKALKLSAHDIVYVMNVHRSENNSFENIFFGKLGAKKRTEVITPSKFVGLLFKSIQEELHDAYEGVSELDMEDIVNQCLRWGVLSFIQKLALSYYIETHFEDNRKSNTLIDRSIRKSYFLIFYFFKGTGEEVGMSNDRHMVNKDGTTDQDIIQLLCE